MSNFEKVIGYEHIKRELERLLDCLNHKEKYAPLGVTSPHGLLLYGDPGLGKTLIAKSFLEATNANKYIIRKSKPDGEFVRFLSDTINEAINNTPSIVLLDDLDKFSNNDDGHKNSDEFITVQSLIDDAKDKDVFFVATANDLDAIPGSLLRTGRFDLRIEVEEPSEEDSRKIIKYYLDNKIKATDIDTEELAKILVGTSCAELENVVNEAGLYAGYHGHNEITMDDIIDASLRALYNTPLEVSEKNEYQMNIAAYHECGHALISEILEPGSVNLVCVRNYFGSTGGVTSCNMDENYWWDIDKMENRIKVLLAGRAAIELVFNKLDVGATSDLRRANNIATRIIDGYGANYLKPISVRIEDFSDMQLSNMYSLVNEKLNSSQKEVKDILFKNRDKLEKMATLLKNKQVLRQKDIREILNA